MGKNTSLVKEKNNNGNDIILKSNDKMLVIKTCNLYGSYRDIYLFICSKSIKVWARYR